MRIPALIILAGLVAVACGVAPTDGLAVSRSELNAAQKVIVIGQPGFGPAALRDRIAAHGGVADLDLGIVNGVAATLPTPAASARLAAEPGVLRIDEDVEVYAIGKPPAAQPPQSTPWGIPTVGAPSVWPTASGAGSKVAILDTGIDLSHPDLQANVVGGVNFVSPAKSANDDNGHGSHVAGTVAASDNTIGVVGVAPTASLYAVKVLNRNGSGTLSGIIAGLDWAVQNSMNVVNMSLGTSSDVQSFHDACDAARAAGVLLVAAAGNSGDGDPATVEAGYPGAYASVLSVAALNQSGATASWSSSGPTLDLAAPGVSVPSTYKGGSYATLSGTSMASPHVAGVAALLFSARPGISADCVATSLLAGATDVGAPGFDNATGYGLVNADTALGATFACQP